MNGWAEDERMVKECGNKVEACKAIKVWKLEDTNKLGPIFDLQADSNKTFYGLAFDI